MYNFNQPIDYPSCSQKTQHGQLSTHPKISYHSPNGKELFATCASNFGFILISNATSIKKLISNEKLLIKSHNIQ